MTDALAQRALTAVSASAANVARRQDTDGSWHFSYGGPTFQLPMYVALRHLCGDPVEESDAGRMRGHLRSTIGPDGGIGMYAGGPSWVFTSTVGYVALRLLGEGPEEEHMRRLRAWIHHNGTPLRSASWGKIVLAVLGLYDYRGVHPLTPETWLMPKWVPVHPRRFWSFARQTYLPMAWLYGKAAAASADARIRTLRAELYPVPYEDIDWRRHRSTVAPCDDQRPLSREFRALAAVLEGWERLVPRRLRARALRRIEEHIVYEDEVTEGVRIGVVNAILNTAVHHFRDPGGEHLRRGLAGVERCLARTETGLDIRSNHSVQLWDTVLVTQALHAADRALGGLGEHAGTVPRALDFIRRQQFREELPQRQRFYRDARLGGWPLSTRAFGWLVSDCTAEALTALWSWSGDEVPDAADARFHAEAVRRLLDMQNPDGGWPTCERIRGGRWLERLNPSQIFDSIMVDYSHVECTASCLEALRTAGLRVPAVRADTDRALHAGRGFLTRAQRADGSFEGMWGICFTYGTWFGIRGLLASGVPATDRRVQRACSFLLSIQRPDGSWGESPLSCGLRRHVPAEEGKAVMTAWALLALTEAGKASLTECEEAVRFLLGRQRPDGGFPREGHAGAFMRTGPLDYDGYRHYFTLWALASWYDARRATDRARPRVEPAGAPL